MYELLTSGDTASERRLLNAVLKDTDAVIRARASFVEGGFLRSVDPEQNALNALLGIAATLDVALD
jgi:hypothetical protein